jgi:transmembrane protein 216
VFVYKGYGLFYPPNSIILEVFLLFLFSFLQFGRISMGSSGNKTESPNTMIG